LKKKRRPIAGFNPPAGKEPRVKESVERTNEQRPAWHVRILDRGGPWCWDSIDTGVLWEIIHSKLSNYEKMKWSEIEGPRNHFIQVPQLIPEARARLAEIDQDDTDSLFSLHLDGKKRILGIRDGHVLKILWWDPDHQVCPSPKKYT
jgi:hypothetical protein